MYEKKIQIYNKISIILRISVLDIISIISAFLAFYNFMNDRKFLSVIFILVSWITYVLIKKLNKN